MNGPLGLRSRETLANRFHLGESLGRTRWGEVYLADDTETGARCRVEVILRSGELGGDLDRRLAREVRIGRELAGQVGFVTAYAWGRLGAERLFIAREGAQPAPFPLLASDELRGRVAAVLEVARRVEVLDALGIAHRDLGPAALVKVDGELHLNGFGLGYLSGVKEPPEDPSGCPLSFLGSAAPEVIRAIDFGGTQADVYSLGALLHAALTRGEWPQPEDLPGIARWLVGYELPAQLSDAPAELDDLRRAALDLDPDARPSASEVAQGLEAWLGAPSERPVPSEAIAGIDLSGRVRPLRTPEPLPGPGPGDVIGARFRLAVRLEQSRWGEVFQASDQVRGRPCRVELVLLSGERAEVFDRLADREVRVCLGIDAPGLLPAIAWGRLGPERLFVAREVVAGLKPIDLSGGSLRQRVRRLALAARRLGSLGKQGVVHRDVGPGTLLEDGEGGIYVSGFARAQRPGVEEPLLSEFTFAPTIAPEALVDPAAAGPRSDVYSLGALLFYALTGRYPFSGPTPFDLLEQHEAVRAGEATVPKAMEVAKGVPPHLSVVCRRALSLSPESRPARPNAFALALEEWLAVEDGAESEADLDALARTGDEDAAAAAAAAAEEPVAPRPPAIPQVPGTSTSIVLREFPESLLIPDSLAGQFEKYLHVCARCEQTSYLLPPMTAETSRCTRCKRGRLRPFGAEGEAAPAPAPAPSDSAIDVLTSSDPGATHTVVLELPESIRAPAGLERSLTEFKFTCMDCLESSYLLPPMTPANSRCTHCAGQLRVWRAGDESLEPEEDLLAGSSSSSSAELEAMPTVTRRATGESRRARRIPEASKLVSMARFRVECWRCGEANFVLPPHTPATSECSACGASLRERRDSDRLVAAVAQVAAPTDSHLSLTADGISLEESDHGTGYIQWTSNRRVPTTPLPKRPAGKRITRKTHRPDALEAQVAQLRVAPPRPVIAVKRPLNAGWLVLLALTALVAAAWNYWPPAPPPPTATAERIDTRALAAEAFDARYRLWLGNKTVDASPRSAWCVLELTHLGRGALGVDVWRPGSEMSCTRSVVRSSGTIELTLRRTYDPAEKSPAWFEGDEEEEGGVVEVWELRGRKVGSGAKARLEGTGKKSSRQWGRASRQTVRFSSERVGLSDEAILEDFEAAAKRATEPKPAPPSEPHG